MGFCDSLITVTESIFLLKARRVWSTKATPGTMTVSPVSAVNGQSDRRVSSPKEVMFIAARAMIRSLPNTVSAAKRFAELTLIL